MKIGKDEIGPIGIIGLILIPVGVFLTSYILLEGGLFLHLLLGIMFCVVGAILYYMDLYDFRKKRQSSQIKTTTTEAQTAIEQLKKLKELLDMEAITKEEFEQKKKILMQNI